MLFPHCLYQNDAVFAPDTGNPLGRRRSVWMQIQESQVQKLTPVSSWTGIRSERTSDKLRRAPMRSMCGKRNEESGPQRGTVPGVGRGT